MDTSPFDIIFKKKINIFRRKLDFQTKRRDKEWIKENPKIVKNIFFTDVININLFVKQLTFTL